MAVMKAKVAIMRPMNRGGIKEGINKRAGIPDAMGMDAAKPACEGDIPFSSNIFGSQLEKPWLIANAKSAMSRRICTLRTANGFANAPPVQNCTRHKGDQYIGQLPGSQNKPHLRIGYAQIIQDGCDEWRNGAGDQAESNV